MTGYVIGIDGGQTSTSCALATVEGRLLGLGRGGPLVHFAIQGARALFLASVGEAARSAWTAAGLTPQPVEAAGLGLTGVEAGTPEAITAAELLPQIIECKCADIQNDGVSALFGAHLGDPGIIAISGTGSIVFGLDPHGQIGRIGGWGWLVGDEGSGNYIGRAAVAAAFRSFDGTAPTTRLEGVFKRHFSLASTRDLKRIVYATDFGARGFAALAPLVGEAASQGDEVAGRIIAQTGYDLACDVAALARQLHFADNPIPVSPVGGAFSHVWGLRGAFVDNLEHKLAAVRVTDPALPPVLGAVIMGLRQVHTAPEALQAAVAQLRNSAADWPTLRSDS